MQSKRKRSGIVSIISLVFLGLFTVLCLTFLSFATGNLHQSANYAHIQTARLQAESGLAYCTYLLGNLQLKSGATGEDMVDDLAKWLESNLNDAPNLNGAAVTYDETSITIPQITTDNLGRGFSTQMSLVDDTTVHIRIIGRDGEVTRTIGMDFQLAPSRSGVFDHGVASQAPVHVSGNAGISCATDPAQANVLSTTGDTDEAFKISGNANLDGDIYATNPDAYATLTGNVSIGGANNWEDDIYDHVHIGVGDVEFPKVDPTVFEPFVCNIVDSDTDTGGDQTFTNIRILAGTNPTFSGNITINGVIFIEAPNNVHFAGNVNITGVIVTEDPGDEDDDENYIKFSGNTVSKGVEELPDTPEFAALREMPGSFILAPGFGVQFTGNFGTVNGSIAAESFLFAGNAGGIVRGHIINFGNSEFRLTGNSHLVIDRSVTPTTPPGFVNPGKLAAIAVTYMEY